MQKRCRRAKANFKERENERSCLFSFSLDHRLAMYSALKERPCRNNKQKAAAAAATTTTKLKHKKEAQTEFRVRMCVRLIAVCACLRMCVCVYVCVCLRLACCVAK